MRRARLLAGAATLAAATTGATGAVAQMQMGAAAPGGERIGIAFASFAPAHQDVLVGDQVTWANDSARVHTVTADSGAFDSGRVPVGSTFVHRFDAAGAFAYHCTLHAGMTGEVDAYPILLDAPTAPAASDRPYPLHGRAALPAGTTVTIEADGGAGETPAASATVGDDGSFAANVTPAGTAGYRAVAGDAASPPVQLIVLDHRVAIRARHRGATQLVTATVTPPAPGGHVVLQERLRDRFGWWPVQQRRLDEASRAQFTLRLRRRTPVRVRLTLPDWATPLAQSPVVQLGLR